MRTVVYRVPAAAPRNATSNAAQLRPGNGGAARAAASAAAAAPPLQSCGGLRGLEAQARPGRLARAQAGAADSAGSNGGGGSEGISSNSNESNSLAGNSQLPELGDVEQLLQSLGLSGAASAPALLGNLRKLRQVRQREVLQHAAAVLQHLCGPGVGLTEQQAGQLLEGCPVLFSREPEQRAAPLFGELMAAGLTAAEAAQCLLVYPSTAAVRSLAAGLSELAAILAHSEDKQGGGPKPKVPAAQRTLAALLQRIPSAVALACRAPGWLLQRNEQLQQAGFSAGDVAALAWSRPEFLVADAAPRFSQAAVVLEEQLGLSTAAAVDLVASNTPSWIGSSIDALRARAAALAEGFGKAQAAAIVKDSPQALNCPPEVWRRNLCCMAACGVADPKAVLSSHPILLHRDHTASAFVQRRLLLQRCFGHTAAQLYAGPAWCLSCSTPADLSQRLQFIEHCGQQHRLVAKAPSGGAAARLPLYERPLGLATIVKAKQPAFLAAVGASETEWAAFQQQHPPAQCALYRWAQQAAEQEVEWLRAALPAELRQVQRRQVHFRRQAKAGDI